jgi:hypothetical protein
LFEPLLLLSPPLLAPPLFELPPLLELPPLDPPLSEPLLVPLLLFPPPLLPLPLEPDDPPPAWAHVTPLCIPKVPGPIKVRAPIDNAAKTIRRFRITIPPKQEVLLSIKKRHAIPIAKAMPHARPPGRDPARGYISPLSRSERLLEVGQNAKSLTHTTRQFDDGEGNLRHILYCTSRQIRRNER